MPDAVVGTNVVLTRASKVALTASDFVIPEGCITAIIGPNGSGKSTLLHAISGLIEPSAGTLTVLGATPELSQPRISYVLQYASGGAAGTPLTVRETVMMGRYPTLGVSRRPSKSDRERVDAALDRLAIQDLAERHLSELSGGQRQRVFVAQGIAQDHAMLLLDEPLTGLDLISMRTIDAIIHDEPARGCSVVLTTHDLDEARAADHVILVAGRIVACGAPEVVLTTANLTSAYGLGALHDSDERLPRIPSDDHHHDHDGPHQHGHQHGSSQ
jgi:iron complex transport system ATP-binding protein